jgi:hypothetical protein
LVFEDVCKGSTPAAAACIDCFGAGQLVVVVAVVVVVVVSVVVVAAVLLAV